MRGGNGVSHHDHCDHDGVDPLDLPRLNRVVKRFRAAVFDMDGLLLDSERIALASFNRVCEHLGLGDQTHVFVRCIGANHAAGWRALEEGLAGKVAIATFASAWDELHSQAVAEVPVPLKEGVVELLDEFASLGLPCAVATSTATERAIRKLGEVGLLDRFVTIVGGDQVTRSKPHPDIYLKAAEELGRRPADCIAFEDSENGVRAAFSAGMTVVQIPDLLQPSDELRSLGHIVLDSLHHVRTYRF